MSVDHFLPGTISYFIQCAGAIRFILRTTGPEYFAYLHNDQSMDGFLDRLTSAVKGGEALRAKEALAVKAGD